MFSVSQNLKKKIISRRFLVKLFQNFLLLSKKIIHFQNHQAIFLNKIKCNKKRIKFTYISTGTIDIIQKIISCIKCRNRIKTQKQEYQNIKKLWPVLLTLLHLELLFLSVQYIFGTFQVLLFPRIGEFQISSPLDFLV